MLRDISPSIQKLAYRKNLTSEEARQTLNTIGSEDEITDPLNSDGFYFLALTFGVMAKGPSADELYGFVLSISDQSICFDSGIDPDNTIDISGTGGDKIKTFNVGTTASIVIAAGGVHVAKQATRGYTGFTGSADIFREIGLDPVSIGHEQILKCLEEVGVVAFYTPAFTSGFKNRIDFLTKLKSIGLAYPTPWHLVSWVYSPFQMNTRIYGVFDKQYVGTLAELFKKLGYQRVLVVHGVDGLDEISNVGETYVAELKNGEIKEYTISPEQYKIPRSHPSDIQTLSDEEIEEFNSPKTDETRRERLRELGKQHNIRTFFEVLYGKQTGAKRDIVLMNAGAAFYLCNKVRDLGEGIDLARSILETGKAREKLKELSAFVGGSRILQKLEDTLGL